MTDHIPNLNCKDRYIFHERETIGKVTTWILEPKKGYGFNSCVQVQQVLSHESPNQVVTYRIGTYYPSDEGDIFFPLADWPYNPDESDTLLLELIQIIDPLQDLLNDLGAHPDLSRGIHLSDKFIIIPPESGN